MPKVKPAVEKIVRPARGAMARAVLSRFIDADLLSQAAALAFYAVLSLAPLMLLLLWLAGALMPAAQGASWLVYAIGWYLEHANPTSTYGSMSALALLWIYYACLVVFIGALFTAVFDERQRAHVK